MFAPHFRLATLTHELRSTTSPVREHFRSTFPHTAGVIADYKTAGGPLLVDGGTAHAGTVGTSIDVLIRLCIDPTHRAIDVQRSAYWTERHDQVVDELCALVGRAILDGPAGHEMLLRAGWGLGLLTETTRTIQAFLQSPASPLVYESETPVADILTLADDDVLRQLDALLALASVRLLPSLAWPIRLTPTLSGSALIRAEPDLIAGSTLLDIKAVLGAKLRSGGRIDVLTAEVIYQVVGYALLDVDDEYGLDKVGIYSARYGRLATWDLRELLERLSGRPLEPADARARLEQGLYDDIW